MNNYQRPYYPRRPVKSFQDLEVYQKLLAVSVAVAKRLDLSVIARNEVTKQSHCFSNGYGIASSACGLLAMTTPQIKNPQHKAGG